jgi:hypothetical protein
MAPERLYVGRGGDGPEARPVGVVRRRKALRYNPLLLGRPALTSVLSLSRGIQVFRLSYKKGPGRGYIEGCTQGFSGVFAMPFDFGGAPNPNSSSALAR